MVQWIENYPVVTTLLATAVAAAFAFWATRKYGNRRIRLRVAWRSVRMVTATSTKNLEIRIGGKVVQDPFLVTLAMYNSGPNDISGAHFSRSMPMDITVKGAEIVDVLEKSDNTLPHALSSNTHKILIGPGLLKIRVRRDLTLITEGEPDGVVWSSLVDVDTDQVPMSGLELSGFALWLERSRAFVYINIAVGLVSLIFLVVSVILLSL